MTIPTLAIALPLVRSFLLALCSLLLMFLLRVLRALRGAHLLFVAESTRQQAQLLGRQRPVENRVFFRRKAINFEAA